MEHYNIYRNGWLDRFKNRYGLYEKKWLAEEADHEAAAEYPEETDREKWLFA